MQQVLQPLHFAAFPGLLLCVLGKAHQGCPQNLPNPAEAQAINTGRVFWGTVTQYKQAPCKDSVTSGSTFTCLQKVQSNYRCFNNLRKSKALQYFSKH